MLGAALALSAASAVMGAMSSDKQSKYQSRVAQQQWEENNEAMLRNYNQQQGQLALQQQQANEEALVKETELQRSIRAEKARLRVATGESGIGGSLVDTLVQNQDMLQAMEMSTIESNRQNKVGQGQYEKITSRMQNTGGNFYDSNGGSSGALKWIGAGLEIGSQAAGAYGKYKSTKALNK